MTKAKAKAERAAARLAAVNVANMALGIPPPTAAAGPSAASEESPAPEPAPENQPQPDPDAPTAATSKEPPVSRSDLLRSKPEVVGRYMQLTVPILVDVYAASVVTPVRVKSLTGLLKAVSFLDADELKRVFTVRIHLPTLDILTNGFSVCPSRELRIVHPVLQGLAFSRHRRAPTCRVAPYQGSRRVQTRVP